MTIWNVSVPVVANIEAPNGQSAVRMLVQALDRAGFIPYEPDGEAEVFEAEQDPEAIGGLPGDNPNCAWVRAKVAERGWAQEIDALATAALERETR